MITQRFELIIISGYWLLIDFEIDILWFMMKYGEHLASIKEQ